MVILQINLNSVKPQWTAQLLRACEIVRTRTNIDSFFISFWGVVKSFEEATTVLELFYLEER